MILHNPTDKDITIQYRGVTKTAPANGDVTVNDEYGNHWLKNVHPFLVVVEGEAAPAAEVVEDAPEEEKVVDEDEESSDDVDEEDKGILGGLF